MSTRSVRLHGVFRAPPEKVYRAFLEPDALSKWLPPYGSHAHAFGGEYLELVANELIRYADRFDNPDLPGEMQVSVSLKPVLCGCDISIVQDGIPEVIPLEMCYLGWQESLAQLATLVEPDIPG